jgi:hypothetical protein
MVRRRPPSIKVQIYSLVWACALPAIVGFALLTAHFIERESDQIKRDTLITARALMLAVDRDLNTGITVALALANSPSLDKRDFAAFMRKPPRPCGLNSPVLILSSATAIRCSC